MPGFGGWAAGAGKAPNAMDHFITCIREDLPHDATGKQGLAVMELLDALYESARNRAPVKLG
jgi:predicted dehydrogenase